MLSILGIMLLIPVPSFAQKQLRIDIPKILENEHNTTKFQEFYEFNALIYCRLGIESNKDYIPIFTKMLIPSISNSLDRASTAKPLPTYNIVNDEDKELLKEVRIALVIKKMREICPDVW
jgi:hypothetical protein